MGKNNSRRKQQLKKSRYNERRIRVKFTFEKVGMFYVVGFRDERGYYHDALHCESKVKAEVMCKFFNAQNYKSWASFPHFKETRF